MGFIHSAKRNRLGVDKATKLTYCYENLRLADDLLGKSVLD